MESDDENLVYYVRLSDYSIAAVLKQLYVVGRVAIIRKINK